MLPTRTYSTLNNATIMDQDPIAVTNRKPIKQFQDDYFPPSDKWSLWPRSGTSYTIRLEAGPSLASADFEACFKLIELTSSEDYKRSNDGWRPKNKRKEMKLLDLKYLLVRNDATGTVEGFLSFMPTYEDEYAVVYVYEIHLAPSLQGSGLGKALMALIDEVASRIERVEKVMLTVFLRNTRAVDFYYKFGFETDEFSPSPRTLRDGRFVEGSYVILSKPVN